MQPALSRFSNSLKIYAIFSFISFILFLLRALFWALLYVRCVCKLSYALLFVCTIRASDVSLAFLLLSHLDVHLHYQSVSVRRSFSVRKRPFKAHFRIHWAAVTCGISWRPYTRRLHHVRSTSVRVLSRNVYLGTRCHLLASHSVANGCVAHVIEFVCRCSLPWWQSTARCWARSLLSIR